MASPGSVDTKQIHDPQEAKTVTDQKSRVFYLFRDLKWKAGRRAFEVWESDGGNVPAEEQVYLVHGELRKGPVARLQWQWEHFKKRLQYFFKGNSTDHRVGKNAPLKG